MFLFHDQTKLSRLLEAARKTQNRILLALRERYLSTKESIVLGINTFLEQSLLTNQNTSSREYRSCLSTSLLNGAHLQCTYKKWVIFWRDCISINPLIKTNHRAATADISQHFFKRRDVSGVRSPRAMLHCESTSVFKSKYYPRCTCSDECRVIRDIQVNTVRNAPELKREQKKKSKKETRKQKWW